MKNIETIVGAKTIGVEIQMGTVRAKVVLKGTKDSEECVALVDNFRTYNR